MNAVCCHTSTRSRFVVNLIKSIPVGIDNALEELGVGRLLGSTPSGPYGVGGPPLPPPPTTAMSIVSALSARSPSEHVAPAADSLTVDAPSAEPATPDAVTRDT